MAIISYTKPELKVILCSELAEITGPACTAYEGTINMDMYRGSAHLDSPAEYRYAQATPTGIVSSRHQENIREVAHV